MVFYPIVFFILLFLLVRYSRVFHIEGLPNYYSSISFLTKVISGIAFLSIYTLYYGQGTLSADAEQFMRESKVLNDVFYQSPGDYFKFFFGFDNSEALINKYLSSTSHWSAGTQTILNDNRNILRVHSIIHFFSFNSVYIHILVMSFISVFSTNNIFLALKKYVSVSPKQLFWFLILLPSLTFWSASILKEPMMILGFSLILRTLLYDDSRKKEVILFFVGLILLAGFKPYILILSLIAVGFYFLYQSFSRYQLLFASSIYLVLFLATVFIFQNKATNFVQLLSRKQFDFVNISKGGIHIDTDTNFIFFSPQQYSSIEKTGDSIKIIKEVDAMILQHGSIKQPVPIHLKPSPENWKIYFERTYSEGYIETTPIDNSSIQLIKNIPEAVTNALFRPVPFDPGGWLKHPAIIETILLFGFLFYTIIKRKKLSRKEKAIIYSTCLFIFLLALLIGWVTPVLGAIVRYRIMAYLGILGIALILYDPNKKRSA
ncbi:MAG TPA: hypothetical protein EYG86_07165 [Crocinitomicaceae bacterium]|nr:hypothetical protein [Crocinitomicaceae bacterium]